MKMLTRHHAPPPMCFSIYSILMLHLQQKVMEASKEQRQLPCTVAASTDLCPRYVYGHEG